MHPILGALETASPGNVHDFLNTLFIQLKKLVQQGVDTPAERKNIEDSVLYYYDSYIAHTLPAAMAGPFRDSLLTMLDAALVALASA